MSSVTFNKPLLYKELAEMFEIEFKEGGSRKRQLEKLMRTYEILKYGKHYVITQELSQIEKLLAKPKLKMQDYIIPLVYTYMHNGKYKGEIIKTKGNMLKDLSIINDNFYAVRSDPYKYSILLDETLGGYDLMRYTETTYKMFCNILDDALFELSNRKLAFVSKIKMMLQIFDCGNGDIIKKGVPLSDSQLKKLTEIQKDYMNSHVDSDGYIYKYWSDIPYIELRDANKWISNKLGYQTFDGYKILLNEKGVEQYIAQNLPDMQHALSDLVENKITTSKRKGIGNIDQNTRHVLVRELNSNRNKLIFKENKEEEE